MSVVGRGADQYTVRFPDGLRDRIRVAADANGRSMNAEIVARLAASFQDADRPAAEDVAALSERVERIEALIGAPGSPERMEVAKKVFAEVGKERRETK